MVHFLGGTSTSLDSSGFVPLLSFLSTKLSTAFVDVRNFPFKNRDLAAALFVASPQLQKDIATG
ncbi:hypothetical protein QU487_03825 [Crenobacter sp. SG2305]|uniref:hypothetical protein n=1 Tax=Crenobacter oryzisoli TaxID=3056844 RepID=UPI0025AB5D0D|nr:hypothetical protein [Crenobacter sp. SG2305]MDN0081889.1 hypothetical protein [Crenobacter sp. SG2305]